MHHLKHVLYSPQSPANLIAMKPLENSGIWLDSKKKQLKTSNGEAVGRLKWDGGVLRLLTKKRKSATAMASVSHHHDMDEIWHRRLGHLNRRDMKKMVPLVEGMTVSRHSQQGYCGVCEVVKARRRPYVGHEEPRELGELIYVDLVGPVKPISWNGFRYWMSITDGLSRRIWARFLKTKDQAREELAQHIEWLWVQYKVRVKRIRLDNESALKTPEMISELKNRGIGIEPTPHYSPQSNGMAEVRQYHVHVRATTMLEDGNLTKRLWPEATEHATFLLSVSPTRQLEVTPWQMWEGKKPQIDHLRIFGSAATYRKERHAQGDKFGPRGAQGRYVGHEGRHIVKI
jgi:transposase InsO family protein